MATGPHPNIMNWYRAKSEVGSEHIEHAHHVTHLSADNLPASRPETEAVPELDRITLINRLGDFARRVTTAEDAT